MLTPEKIAKNAKKYFTTCQEHGFMVESLMTFLGVSIVESPCSTHRNMHNSFPGGLISHMLLTTKHFLNLNDILPEPMKVDKESIIKVSLLYQIGKAKLFVPCTSEWHKSNLGKNYDFNPELLPMRVGERSILYLMEHGVKLSECEYNAILSYDKMDDDKEAKYFNCHLGILLKMANDLAAMEEKKLSENE